MSTANTTIRACLHCRGTGFCRVCRGRGQLPLQRGKKCTSCFPKGSGFCQNCRGLGGRGERGYPAAFGRAAAIVAAERANEEKAEADEASTVKSEPKTTTKAKKPSPKTKPVPRNGSAKTQSVNRKTGSVANPSKRQGSEVGKKKGN